MVPTLGPTLGVKGHRPTAATRDCKDLLYVFAVVNLLSAALHTNTLESPKGVTKKTGQSKTRRLQEAFAEHLRHVGRVYPAHKYAEVVLLIDNAPWHARQGGAASLGRQPAPEVQAFAQLQPAVESHRAVLEETATAGDAQPTVRPWQLFARVKWLELRIPSKPPAAMGHSS